jgi:hypothetical protein
MNTPASSEPIVTPRGESPAPPPAPPALSADTNPQAAEAGGGMRGVGAMGPRASDAESSPRTDALRTSASEARHSGRRFDLMRYLRLRRVK